MNFEFKRELPPAKVVKDMYPISAEAAAVKVYLSDEQFLSCGNRLYHKTQKASG